MSKTFESYLAARGVKHTKSSVYWPRGNSTIERFNKTFKSWVSGHPPAAFVAEVRKCLALYRATPHTTTGKSPSELLHGRQMRLILPVVQTPATQDDAHIASRVQRRQQSNKTAYDRRHGAVTPDIEEGDYVCIRRPGHRSKTSRRFTSPMRVDKRVGRATYRLADGRTWNAAHLARLPAEQSELPPTAPDPDPDVVVPGPPTSPAAVPGVPPPDPVGSTGDWDQGPRRGTRVRQQTDFYVP